MKGMTARALSTAPSHEDLSSSHGVSDYRPRLLGLAYRMLGDVDEAEDVVQETLLRWQLADQDAIRSPEAWLRTVATRLSVDRLRRLRTERSTYPGPWLPEPIATESALAPASPPPPDHKAELASDLSVALLLLLERLTPEERAAFLLRDVCDSEYAEIARVLERSCDAVRQMVHRARVRIRSERTRVAEAPGQHERLLDRFVDAIHADDVEGLIALLAPDVVLASDGGGRVHAARNRLTGTWRVTRLLLGIARKRRQSGRELVYRKTYLNGTPARLGTFHDAVYSAVTIDVEEGSIRAVHIMRNPEKLRYVLEATVPLV